MHPEVLIQSGVQVLLAAGALTRTEHDMNAEPFSMSKATARLGRVAILWRGNEPARRSAAPGTSCFKDIFAALADAGVDAEPVVYEDDVLEVVRGQLATFDGVLVWSTRSARGATVMISTRCCARSRREASG